VREVGRGRSIEERSLEIREVLRGGGRRWWRQETTGLRKFISSDNNFIMYTLRAFFMEHCNFTGKKHW